MEHPSLEQTVGDATLVEGEPVPTDAEALPGGETVGRYVVLRTLGSGGMGVVYAAYDPELDRKVAVKLLHQQAVKTPVNTEGRGRLMREAQAMAKLQHPNVVAVHDVGQYDNRVYLAMEFVRGQTLADWLGESRPWREILDVFLQAGRGLAAAHARGLVHRDFKPENVMVGSDGRVRVMDFGLARADDEDVGRAIDSSSLPGQGILNDNLTRAGAVLGTPRYMAPEQFLGAPTDATTDQFAFCIALYESLYAQRPFGDGDTIAAIAFNVCEGQLRPPPSGSGVPGWVRAAVLRGLETVPEDRFAAMDDLLAALSDDPTRRRRRAFALGAIVLAVGGLYGTYQVARAGTIEGCEQAGARIEETWNETRAGELKAHFEGAGAASTWDKTRPWLDDYARDWKASRTAICMEANIEQTRTQQMLQLAADCLEERGAAFAATLGAMAELGPATIHGAIESATGLLSLDRCRDDAWLLKRPTPPRGQLDHSALAQVRGQLARADALGEAGDYDAALAVAEAAAAEADALGWDVLRAETLVGMGRAHENLGDYPRARELHERAFMMALEAGDGAAAARAATRLTVVTGYRFEDADEGLRWGRIAASLHRQIGDDEGLTHATLLNAIGLVHRRNGRSDEALPLYEQAMAIRERVLGPTHPLVGQSLNNIGVVHRTREDYPAAEDAYRRAHAIRLETYGPDHPNTASTIANLAVLMDVWGKTEEAVELNREALAMREKSLGPDHPDIALTLDNLGLAHRRLSQYDEALSAYARALKIRETALGAEHPTTAETLSKICAAYRYKKEPESSLPACERAVRIREKALGPQHRSLAHPLTSLGATLLALEDYPAAIEVHERALAIRIEAHGQDHGNVAASLGFLGKAHAAAGDHARATDAFERELATRLRIEDEAEDIAGTRLRLAKSLWDGRGDRARAVKLATEARDALRADGSNEAWLADAEAWLAAHRL